MSDWSQKCNVAPGLSFYNCTTTGFLGCCSVDPCTVIGCPDGADCIPSRGETICGLFCCPQGYLCIEYGQFCRNSDGDEYQSFVSPVSTTASQKSASSSVHNLVITGSTSAAAHSSPLPESGMKTIASASTNSSALATTTGEASNHRAHTAAIAGSVGGAFGALIAAFTLGFFLFLRRKRKRQHVRGELSLNEKGQKSSLGSPPGDMSIQDMGSEIGSPLSQDGLEQSAYELPGDSTPGIAELSPNPEREAINLSALKEPEEERPPKRKREHIMSWLDYDGTN